MLFSPFSSTLFYSLSLRSSSSLFFSSPISPNPNRAMSSSRTPNAFDKLMSGARAAAAKKRKTPTPEENPKPEDASATATPAAKFKPEIVKEAQEDAGKLASPPKKPRAASGVEERTAQLKSRIALLKRKANEFDPNGMANWGKGERVPFMFVSLALDLIEKESGRIVITDIMCNMLRTVIHTTPEDLLPAVYLAANKIAPAHEGLELGIGDALIIKAVAEACGGRDKEIKKRYVEVGDLGIVAEKSRLQQKMMQKPEPLTVTTVLNTFRTLAKESGKHSQEKKKNRMKALLVAATDCEPKYLTRLLQGELRIGLAGQTLVAALGQAAVYSEEHSKPPPEIQSPLEEAARIVKQVYSLLPDYEKIIPALLSGGVWILPKTCNFTLGIPVGPMVAKASKGVSEIVRKFQDTEYTCEYKYDGERAQIHYMEDGSVEIFSRNAERNTGKFPDVAVAVSRLKKSSVNSFVLDCEVVAYDRENKKILPFQVLRTRARKNVSISDIKVEVCIFAFDILFHNGRPLIQEQLKVRREYLYDSFNEEAGVFQFATAITSNDIDEIQKFLDAAVIDEIQKFLLPFNPKKIYISHSFIIPKQFFLLSSFQSQTERHISPIHSSQTDLTNSTSQEKGEKLYLSTCPSFYLFFKIGFWR